MPTSLQPSPVLVNKLSFTLQSNGCKVPELEEELDELLDDDIGQAVAGQLQGAVQLDALPPLTLLFCTQVQAEVFVLSGIQP